MLEAKAVPADALFRVFTACAADPRPLVIDVRGDKKKWDRGHVAGAYCIRVPSNGAALLGECAARRMPRAGPVGAALPLHRSCQPATCWPPLPPPPLPPPQISPRTSTK